MLPRVPPLLPTLQDSATIRRDGNSVRDNSRREPFALPITPLRRVPTRERRNAALTDARKRTDAPRPVPGLLPTRRRDSGLPRQRTPLIMAFLRAPTLERRTAPTSKARRGGTTPQRRARRFHPIRRRDGSPVSPDNSPGVPIRRGRDSGRLSRRIAMTITAPRRVPTEERRNATTPAVRRRSRKPRPVRLPAIWQTDAI